MNFGKLSLKAVIVLALAFTMLIGASPAGAKSWKFGVMCDTQWLNYDDGKNPNTVAVEIIKQLNQRFKDANVQFVVQVGDLTDKGDRASYKFCITPGCNTSDAAGEGITWYSLSPGSFTVPGLTVINGVSQGAASRAAIGTRAIFAQELYNAGIGYFPVRGNHEESKDSAVTFAYLFPQTVNGLMNSTPSGVFGMPNPDPVSQSFPLPDPSVPSFVMGANFSSPPIGGLTGLSYSFDYENARFVLLDQFTRTDGSTNGANSNILDQVDWVSSTLAGKPANGHAFVFSHKNLMGQNHVDMLFGSDPSKNAAPQTTFIDAMATYGARYSFSGHDHIYQHSLVKASQSDSVVHNIITASDSNKFYIPLGNTEWTGLPANDPNQAIDSYYDHPPRETTIAQERYKVGYFIVTVDGSRVNVEYYSADNTGAVLDANSKEYLISATPALEFKKKDTFGYDLNGHEYLVKQTESYTFVDETYISTTAKILTGTNNSIAQDGNGRPLTKDVNTGWRPAEGQLASNIFSLWGMADLGSDQTDQYVLSMSFDQRGIRDQQGNGGFGIASRDANGNWVNAVSMNFGGAQATFVKGPWKSTYGLGTYGIDSKTKTAWAVVNHNGEFAITTGI